MGRLPMIGIAGGPGILFIKSKYFLNFTYLWIATNNMTVKTKAIAIILIFFEARKQDNSESIRAHNTNCSDDSAFKKYSNDFSRHYLVDQK